MRVLVCGGRDFTDYSLMCFALNEVHSRFEITDIIHGCAKGADMLAHMWAMENKRDAGRYIRVWQYPADWKTHGKAAGPIRNQRMLDEGRPDLLIAFPGGSGTADMVRRARAIHVEVREIT